MYHGGYSLCKLWLDNWMVYLALISWHMMTISFWITGFVGQYSCHSQGVLNQLARSAGAARCVGPSFFFSLPHLHSTCSYGTEWSLLFASGVDDGPAVSGNGAPTTRVSRWGHLAPGRTWGPRENEGTSFVTKQCLWWKDEQRWITADFSRITVLVFSFLFCW